MKKEEIKNILFSKDTKEAYAKFKELEIVSDISDEIYKYFDLYIEALGSPHSGVRGRGFKLIMRNSKWDTENKISQNLNKILAVLDDEKPTVVRQCLTVLPVLGKYKKELIPDVKKKLENLDYMKYKESMQGLIAKDIDKVLSAMDT